MKAAQLQAVLTGADCEAAFDNLTRQLYATDASIYQIEPMGVAYPRNTAQAAAAIRCAAEAGVPVIPRGAGTGLIGGAIGSGLIIELSRHLRQICGLDLERRTVQVGAGVVLDTLNSYLKPHGFWFGPDVATSSRATLGGMIANDSSGARVALYGTTADHVLALEIALADGRIETVGPGRTALAPQRELAGKLAGQHATAIAERMPPGLLKRWPGYGLNRFLREPNNLNHLLAGSEGTLAAILSAELKIVPLPRQKGLGLVFFASVAEAMQATVSLLDLRPAAVEHLDRLLFDQTKGQPAFRAVRDLLELDTQPCEALLMVEFFDDDVPGRLATLASRRLGQRTLTVVNTADMNRIWALRQAGLSLLTGCKGPAKPVTGIEDVAVRPQQLPAYVAGLEALLKPLGLGASYYGHAAAGLLHVRPVLDLRRGDDLKKFRQLANEVSALVRQFRGSLAAEHGSGMARTEFLAEHLGEDLLGVMRQIKTAFDPHWVFNPGKVLGPALPPPAGEPAGQPPGEALPHATPPEFKIDTHLRLGAGYQLRLSFEPALAFAAKDGSFIGNLEQCNGCGGCRKETPTMCPTFLATGEEIMSTRGRANTIRAVLEGRGLAGRDPLQSVELAAALDYCLACKACATECPSNVNLALLKAELLHARHQRQGLSLRARLLSHVDRLGRLGCLAPTLANAALAWPWLRWLLARTLGLTAKRPLPPYARQRFDHWFARRSRSSAGARGEVILWDDTFVRYHEPHIGQAAVAVLEAAGFTVRLPVGRQCCGRPAFSQGHFAAAKKMGRHNLELLTGASGTDKPGPAAAALPPILFLEPSCYSMFADDYRELRLAGAEVVAQRCFLFEQFIADLLEREPQALRFAPQAAPMAIHAHCHAKARLNPAFLVPLVQRTTQQPATLMDTGCCGMAGAFGALESSYELSRKVGLLMVEKIQAQPVGAFIVASGTSCRHQIEHLTRRRPKHPAEVLAEALAKE